MVDQTESVDLGELENMLLLKGAELESIQGLLETCSVQCLKKGEVLIHAGQPNHILYLLLSGRLRIHLELELNPIVVLEPGEIVGELSLIDGQLTSANVVADKDCRLLVLGEKALWSLCIRTATALSITTFAGLLYTDFRTLFSTRSRNKQSSC